MERTKAETMILIKNAEYMQTIALQMLTKETPESTTLVEMFPILKEMDEHCESVEELEAYLDEQIAHINYLDTSKEEDSKNGYATKYDIRSAGSHLYSYKKKYEWNGKEESTTTDVYKETVVDKFHTYISLLYYTLHGFIQDYTIRQDIVLPVSACAEWEVERENSYNPWETEE